MEPFYHLFNRVELCLIRSHMIALRCLSLIFDGNLKHWEQFVWARIRQRMTMLCYCRMLMLRRTHCAPATPISWGTKCLHMWITAPSPQIKECWCCYCHESFHTQDFLLFSVDKQWNIRRRRMPAWRITLLHLQVMAKKIKQKNGTLIIFNITKDK